MNTLIELKEALRWLLQLHRKSSSAVRVFKYVPASRSRVQVLGAIPQKGDALPVPPSPLWLGYGSDEREYLESGEKDVRKMKQQLEAAGFSLSEGMHILDFGCGGGRMIRHWENEARECSVWGCDISADHVYWLKGHLSPPFRFFLNTTIPHLPFRDQTVDLVYAGSVFTHIDDFAEAWLLELARILRPGGYAWISIHDEQAVTILNSPDSPHSLSRLVRGNRELEVLDRLRSVVLGEDAESQVFYAEAYFRHMVEHIFEVKRLVPEGYGYQTAYVLKRRNGDE